MSKELIQQELPFDLAEVAEAVSELDEEEICGCGRLASECRL
jgi:hypothetical protein